MSVCPCVCVSVSVQDFSLVHAYLFPVCLFVDMSYSVRLHRGTQSDTSLHYFTTLPLHTTFMHYSKSLIVNSTFGHYSYTLLLHIAPTPYRRQVEASVQCAVEVTTLGNYNGRYKLSHSAAAEMCKGESEKGYATALYSTLF